MAAGLAHEEERVGYLSNQTTLMMQILEEEGEGGKLYMYVYSYIPTHMYTHHNLF